MSYDAADFDGNRLSGLLKEDFRRPLAGVYTCETSPEWRAP